MQILIAPDSFKGSLTSLEVAENIEKGVKKAIADADIIKIPMADGGEGTVKSLIDATGGQLIEKQVTGPLGNDVNAYFGLLGDQKTAVIEMAVASGLCLIPDEAANPFKTTTYGTGELIAEALKEDIDELIIGIGGSATNDAGVGMAQALGIHFFDSEGDEIGFGGSELARIETIDTRDINPRVKDVRIRVACDVSNPFYGEKGAARVYGPQKGATPEMVEDLDRNLQHLAKIIKRELGKVIDNIPGAGAAGGLGGGLVAFCDAELESGVDIILDVNDVEEKIAGSDLVITGEGKLDSQTIEGKTPIGVARTARKYNKPVIAIAGIIDDDAGVVIDKGIDAYFSIIQKPLSLKEIMENTPEWLQKAGEQVTRTFLLGRDVDVT